MSVKKPNAVKRRRLKNKQNNMNRHLSRVIIMQSLYEWDFRPESDITEIKKRNIENYHEDVDLVFIDKIIDGVIGKQKEIDEKIITAAPEWPLEQISTIDKTILRISIYELLFNEDAPPKVIINEAVELGKTFGGENSSKFINGVLGTIYRESPQYDPKDDTSEDTKKGDK